MRDKRRRKTKTKINTNFSATEAAQIRGDSTLDQGDTWTSKEN